MSTWSLANFRFGGALLALNGLMERITESILLAVPKKKVTHGRKRLRSLTKGLNNRNDISRCPSCSSPKQLGQVCWSCLTGYFKNKHINH